MTNTGKFIAIYGINNIGKTTQAKKLTERLDGVYVKYAVYDLEPSGPELNVYLRKGNPEALSPREFQLLQILNRTQYEPRLERMLLWGTHVVAEDYVGTGIAWGVGTGLDKDFLARMNSHLRKEDIAILLDGEQFMESVEPGHVHEENTALVKKVRQIHLDLANEFGWHIVNANQPDEKVHDNIWQIIAPIL